MKGLAIAALVLSILAFIIGWVPILGHLIWLAALVLSIVAVIKVKKEGRGLAIAALVITILSVFMLIVGSVALISFFTIVSTEKFMPDSFTLGQGFAPGNFQHANNSLQLTIRNMQGTAVTIQEAAFETDEKSDVACTYVIEAMHEVTNEESFLITIPCSAEEYEIVSGELTIYYMRDGDRYQAVGSITTTSQGQQTAYP